MTLRLEGLCFGIGSVIWDSFVRMKQRNAKEVEEERQLKQLASILEKHGVTVRRENLSRGSSFRVKSGGCYFSGEKILFLDKRLPLSQQKAVLIDHAVELELKLEATELEQLPTQIAALLLPPDASPAVPAA